MAGFADGLIQGLQAGNSIWDSLQRREQARQEFEWKKQLFQQQQEDRQFQLQERERQLEDRDIAQLSNLLQTEAMDERGRFDWRRIGRDPASVERINAFVQQHPRIQRLVGNLLAPGTQAEAQGQRRELAGVVPAIGPDGKPIPGKMNAVMNWRDQNGNITSQGPMTVNGSNDPNDPVVNISGLETLQVLKNLVAMRSPEFRQTLAESRRQRAAAAENYNLLKGVDSAVNGLAAAVLAPRQPAASATAQSRLQDQPQAQSQPKGSIRSRIPSLEEALWRSAPDEMKDLDKWRRRNERAQSAVAENPNFENKMELAAVEKEYNKRKALLMDPTAIRAEADRIDQELKTRPKRGNSSTDKVFGGVLDVMDWISGLPTRLTKEEVRQLTERRDSLRRRADWLEARREHPKDYEVAPPDVTPDPAESRPAPPPERVAAAITAAAGDKKPTARQVRAATATVNAVTRGLRPLDDRFLRALGTKVANRELTLDQATNLVYKLKGGDPLDRQVKLSQIAANNARVAASRASTAGGGAKDLKAAYDLANKREDYIQKLSRRVADARGYEDKSLRDKTASRAAGMINEFISGDGAFAGLDLTNPRVDSALQRGVIATINVENEQNSDGLFKFGDDRKFTGGAFARVFAETGMHPEKGNDFYEEVWKPVETALADNGLRASEADVANAVREVLSVGDGVASPEVILAVIRRLKDRSGQ